MTAEYKLDTISGSSLLYALAGSAGVIFGALITTTISMINSHLQRRADAHLSTRKVREEQYFAATEILSHILEELRAFQIANSGIGVVAGKRKSLIPWRNVEYRRADRRAVEAFNALQEAADRVQLQRAMISVVGSRRASECFSSCYSIVDAYMTEVVRQAREDGRFIYSISERYIAEFEDKRAEAISLFRADLRVSD